MGISATLLSGVPPTGRGVYVKNTIDPFFDFFVINAEPSRRAAMTRQVDEAKRLGKAVWIYLGPDFFLDGNAVASVQYLASKAIELQIEGIVVDQETTVTRATAIAMAQAMRAASRTVRVGFTSFPHVGNLSDIVREAGPGVWYSPQIYGRTSQTAEAFRAWYSLWTSKVNAARVIPSIAGWDSHPSLSTPAGYREYLSRLPRSSGYIIWDYQGEGLEDWRREALRAYSPGGSVLGTAANGAIAFLARPMGVVIVIVAILVLLGIGWMVNRA